MKKQPRKNTEFVIDADKWICGWPTANYQDSGTLGSGTTSMLNDRGYMCCLGQCMSQIGFDVSGGRADPQQVLKHSSNKKFNPFTNAKGKNSTLSSDAIAINDATTTSVVKKVEQLRELFKKHGLKIRFINIKKHLK